MDRRIWIVIGALCVIGLGALIVVTKKEQVNVDNLNPATIIQPSETSIGDHIFGNIDAKVVLYEYADFQCPACSYAHTNVKKITELYKETVAYVFRNYPLTSIHPNALAAATVAEAAGLQGKYWEMNNLLFEKRQEWVDLSASSRGDTFKRLAGELGLDATRFTDDLSVTKVQEKIKLDTALGQRSGVDGTPTFFIGGTKLDKTTTNDIVQKQGEKLMDALDKAIKDAGGTPPNRT